MRRLAEITEYRYGEAYKAIQRALNGIAPPLGKRITKLAFTWNPDGSIATLTAYDSDELLFTLSFKWSENHSSQDLSHS